MASKSPKSLPCDAKLVGRWPVADGSEGFITPYSD